MSSRGAKETEVGTNGEVIVEDFLLFVGLLSNRKNRLTVDRRKLGGVAGLYGGRQPVFVLPQYLPDGFEQRRLIVLEIEVQNDHWPLVALVFRDGFFHDRANLLEEIVFESLLFSSRVGSVRDDNAAFASSRVNIPGEVLLD